MAVFLALSQKDGFLQPVLRLRVLQVGFEVAALVARAVSDVLQVFRGPGTDDIVRQQHRAFPEQAALLDGQTNDAVGVECTCVTCRVASSVKPALGSVSRLPLSK